MPQKEFYLNSKISIGPKLPMLHWAMVLALSIGTLGLFGLFWMFRQAQFVRKIDRTNKAVLQIGASAALLLSSILLGSAMAATTADGGQTIDLGGVMMVLQFFQIVTMISAYMQIRKTLIVQYGLALNALWTVVFHVFYVQHHLWQLADSESRDQPAGLVLPRYQVG